MTIFSRQHTQINTIQGICDRILLTWTKEDLEFVKSERYDFGMVGRRIRNDFGLWDPAHPLTQHWHLHPDCRNIVNGIDFSEDHPDNISGEILALVRKAL